MMRTATAMSLGLGLGLALSGCGPTADEPAPKPTADASAPAVAPKDEAAPAPGGGAMGGPPPGGAMAGPPPGASKGGGAGGQGGPTPETLKGMMTPAYRAANDAAESKNKGGTAGPGGEAPKEGAEKPKDQPGDSPKEKDAPGEPKKEGEPKAEAVVLSAEEIATIKKLPDAPDQEAALAQKICPVGEEDGKPNHLGSMGKPVKVEVKGKTLFVCCGSCVEDIKKDPDKYLSKIGK